MLEARHDVASAAAAIAMVNSHIARSLAWSPDDTHAASFKSSLDAAVRSAQAAVTDLQRALLRCEIAQT